MQSVLEQFKDKIIEDLEAHNIRIGGVAPNKIHVVRVALDDLRAKAILIGDPTIDRLLMSISRQLRAFLNSKGISVIGEVKVEAERRAEKADYLLVASVQYFEQQTSVSNFSSDLRAYTNVVLSSVTRPREVTVIERDTGRIVDHIPPNECTPAILSKYPQSKYIVVQ